MNHQLIGAQLLLWFAGLEPPAEIENLLRGRSIGGVTLFRHLNGGTPGEIRALSAALQTAARANGRPPLLICADQEGGQLLALAGTTPFPGNMALGAAGSSELARRAGHAIGAELAAMGINVNYAPVCDINSNPANPVIGVRSFGEQPALVARLAAAMIEGMQAAGVAATAKHFPGHGDTGSDSHHMAGIVPHARERLAQVELVPFAAAIKAGAQLVMSAHLALPALSGNAALPATLDEAILNGLLRDELGFRGVIVSDAMNMAGLGPPEAAGETAVRALAAGVDLLLLGEPNDAQSVLSALDAALEQGRLKSDRLRVSIERIAALQSRLAAQQQPELEVVGCAAHRELAAEIAAHAITLVRDQAARLPLRLSAEARIAVVTPELLDLTPADTSSYERCELARAVRRYHARCDELIMPGEPDEQQVIALRERLADYDLVIMGTLNAGTRPGQAALVNQLLRRGVALITVALRLPYDLAAYPAAPTYLCSYSVLPPAMEALADGLWGRIPFRGRLPVSIPGLYALQNHD